MSRRRDPGARAYKHRRVVRISVCIPATVVLEVGTNDEPEDDTDWQVLEVRSANCEATPRQVTECMHDTDFEALAALAFSAEDI